MRDLPPASIVGLFVDSQGPNRFFGGFALAIQHFRFPQFTDDLFCDEIFSWYCSRFLSLILIIFGLIL